MKTIKEKVEEFRKELTSDIKFSNSDEYKKMVKQIDTYWEKLFADPIAVHTPTGVRFVQPQRTNNILERFFRDRLVTQGTRSIKGRKSNERLWTVIATCALQGRSAFNFILESVKASFQNQTPPSLLPGSS